MNISVFGLERQVLVDYIAKTFPSFTVTDDTPELIVSYGGDGTLLLCERKFPGVPKVMIRSGQVCAQCAESTKEVILRLLEERNFVITDYAKIQGQAHGTTVYGLNDIVIGHPRINGTIRATVDIDGKQYSTEVLGDGFVASTPLGSTGYYQSITRSNFRAGIGLAFNNSINVVSHIILKADAQITVHITRGPALVSADNDEDSIALDTGDTVTITTADKMARMVEFPQEFDRFNVYKSTNRMPLGFCQICGQHYGK